MVSPSIQPGATIFVTGVNGLLGSHVVDQLLKRGYNVRGAVRNVEKNKWVTEYFDKKYKDAKIELVDVPDMTAEGAYDAHVHGVEGFIHVAAPVSGFEGYTDIQSATASSIAGGLNALKASAKSPSIKSVSYTSSSVAAAFPRPNVEFSITDKSYNDESLKAFEVEPSKKTWYLYAANKTKAERAMWKWVEENKPKFTFNTILPNANFGLLLIPQHQGYPTTVGWGRTVWTGEGLAQMSQVIAPQWFISPQDTALLHIAPVIYSGIESERLFGYAEPFTFNQILDIYRKQYPNKKFHDNLEGIGEDKMKVPNQRAEEMLRLIKGSGWDGLENSVLDMCAEWGRE